MKNQMNIVIVGHVDHGKSTVVGRVLADTGSLPQGKLDAIKAQCERNARPFEYAFLLDALKDEQSQGITIDTARCFFKTEKRHYIVIDAPGHIEFLKNMISGAARAEAALLIIDADEGIQENSRRHGFMLGLLGITQVTVLVNKMDLVGYSQSVFDKLVVDYSEILKQSGVNPTSFIPVSAREGDLIVGQSDNLPWYTGPSVLDQLDAFTAEPAPTQQAFRMPVQDVYKFTEQGDSRRIITGTIASGVISVGDTVTFFPSGKSTTVASIECFNAPVKTSAVAGEATGVTLATQLYIKAGDIMTKAGELPIKTGTQLRVRLFWMGRSPMILDKKYKFKLCTTRVQGYLTHIEHVLDASTLVQSAKPCINRHDVATAIITVDYPISFDCVSDLKHTSRFVIVDGYDIVGGGIIADAIDTAESDRIDQHRQARNTQWLSHSDATQKPVIIITGDCDITQLHQVAVAVARSIGGYALSHRDQAVSAVSDQVHFLQQAGIQTVTAIPDLTDDTYAWFQSQPEPVIIGVDSVSLRRTALSCHVSSDTHEAKNLATILAFLKNSVS